MKNNLTELGYVDKDVRAIFEDKNIIEWPHYLPSIIQLNKTLKEISELLRKLTAENP